MTNVCVVVPFRSTDPERRRIFSWALARWQKLVPDEWAIAVRGDGQTEGPFNRSRAVNAAVAATGADVVIVSDGDTAVRHGQAEAMVRAIEDHPYVIGYSRFVHLAKIATEEALTSPVDIPLPENPQGPSVRFQSWESVCGLWAMRREDHHAIGGQDERYSGWGAEDSAFAMKASTLLAPPHRLPGVGLHLHHHLRADRKTDASARANFALLTEYEKAEGDPAAMTAIVRASLAAT